MILETAFDVIIELFVSFLHFNKLKSWKWKMKNEKWTFKFDHKLYVLAATWTAMQEISTLKRTKLQSRAETFISSF